MGAQAERSIEELARAGVEARSAGRLADAEGHFSALVEKAPDLVAGWLNLGLVRHERRRYAQAVEALQTAWELDPSVPDLDGLLGFDLVQLGRFEAAAPHLERALGKKPNEAFLEQALVEARLGLAQRRTADGELEQAIEEYRAALEVDPTRRGVRRTIADLDFELGRLEQSIAGYRAELDLGPEALSYERLGDALLQLGRSEEALEPLRRAVEMAPGEPGPRILLGKALLDLGRLDRAQDTLELALASADSLEQDAKAHYALGMLHRKRGERKEASRHLDEFRRLRSRMRAQEATP